MQQQQQQQQLWQQQQQQQQQWAQQQQPASAAPQSSDGVSVDDLDAFTAAEAAAGVVIPSSSTAGVARAAPTAAAGGNAVGVPVRPTVMSDPFAGAAAAAAAAAVTAAPTDGSQSARGLRTAFNVSHPSHKNVADVMAEVKRVINMNRIQCQFDSLFAAGAGAGAAPAPTVLSCEKGPIRFEMEVTSVPNSTEHVVRMKRVSGDSWAYKNLCNRIIPQLRL